MTYTIEAVGRVRGGRSDPIDDDWGQRHCVIELDPAEFGFDALAGLDAFSHAEIIFLFDQVTPAQIEKGARHHGTDRIGRSPAFSPNAGKTARTGLA